MSYLLDTNVVSELRKPRRDAGVTAWFDQIESTDLYLSVLVVGEIKQGVERLRRRGDERQAAVFDAWLTVLKEEFADRLLPVSTGIAERWGHLNAARPVPVVDGLLAATAIEHEMTLVTRESRALESMGVHLLDPWSERL